MKSKNSKDDPDYEIKFWKDWLNADPLKRMGMVEKLPIINEILGMAKLPSKYRKRAFAMLLNGFFEDLESAVYTKIRLEEKSKRE
ncbi:MAG TPA: hypothetical protein VJB06_02385 [archaeon]|nr:hypothetical protein [archaeon]